MSSGKRIKASIISLVLVCAASAYAAERFSDPTRPPAVIRPAAKAQAKDSAQRPLELQAILHAEGRRVAIINGKRVHENETIEAATIVEITKVRVRMIREGQPIELSLSNERIKKTESSKTRNPAREDATEGKSK